MKIVSFEVAKSVKEAGYPQEWNDTEFYYTENGELKCSDDYEGNSIEDIMYYQRYAVPAPFVMEIWLWLWREKGTPIRVDYAFCGIDDKINDPEEAIETTIEYLVKNDLIK